jgi:hypothetical protein
MKFPLIFVVIIFLFLIPNTGFAIVDPLTMENNKFGIHIFDASEIDQVKDLVNSNGGEWGYVTVPLRADDRNLIKWNNFMHKAKENKLIPIIRLATYMTTTGWSKPAPYDDVDFANFLNDLDWPVKNRYIIVYNEPNHADEWGGVVSPSEYAKVLATTAQTFKDRNADFFILPAGLDAAAPNDNSHMNWKRFLQLMESSNPRALALIDGWNSHSYPNPAFSSAPTSRSDHSIISFQYEKKLVESMTGKHYPVFITETGWSSEFLSNQTIANYLETAVKSVWHNSEIVAITPFVLNASAGPFEMFSFFDHDGKAKPQYEIYKNLIKIKGQPVFGDPHKIATDSSVLGISTQAPQPTPTAETENAKNVIIKLWHWLEGNKN